MFFLCYAILGILILISGLIELVMFPLTCFHSHIDIRFNRIGNVPPNMLSFIVLFSFVFKAYSIKAVV